ncbi:MAG: enoyl-CoA hydratase/isomerase family protein, partial [Desulfobacteraceae bacterium]|nr:enoyl-CoA hydratase/isomerase family protein [Desulfobacteraceae bacterium]
MITQDLLIKQEENQAAIFTLNRPAVMNCLNFDLLYALRDEIDRLQFADDIRCVIITGAGEKAFCAGADLKERATLPPEKVQQFILTIRNLLTSIQNLKMPVISAVNGIA